MELYDVIENRRSIRNYIKKDIPNEVVLDILNCGRLAPSVKNRQLWYFVVVKNKIKDQIADLMIDYTINHDDTQERKLIGHASSVNPTAIIIKQAPVLVLVFREKNDVWTVGDNLSIGACVENMCLRATDLGIGSLWIRDTVYVQEEIANLVNHGDLEMNCALLLGYTEQKPKMRPRKKLEDIVEWYV